MEKWSNNLTLSEALLFIRAKTKRASTTFLAFARHSAQPEEIIMTLSDSFIQSILEPIDSSDVIGVGLVGSYTRGQESKYSDVDLDLYVSKLPENKYER